MTKFYTFVKNANKKFAPLIFLTALLFPVSTFGQVVEQVPFNPRTSPFAGNKTMYNIKGDFVTMGNTNLTWHRVYGFDRDLVNNWMAFVNTDPLYANILRNSSSSTLKFSTEQEANPDCSRVLYAGLYWTGRSYNIPPATFPSVPNYDPANYPDYLFNNSSDSVPVVVWRTDTNYVVVDEIYQWYPSGSNVPGLGAMTICCNSSGGSGHTQVYTFPGVIRIAMAFRNGPVVDTDCGIGTTVPFNSNGSVRVSKQDWVGPPTNWTPIESWSDIYNIPAPPTNAVGFAPITFSMNGIDSVQISGIAGASNCSGGSQQVRITTKVMRIDIFDVVDTIIWYRKDEIKLRHANDQYFTLRAQANDIYYPQGDVQTGVYVAYADITDYVNQWGEGEYLVADLALQAGPSGTPGLYGGWGMVVVYENEKMIPRSVSVLDGYTFMNGPGNLFNIHIDGFNPVQEGAVGINVGVMAGGGAANLTGDAFSISLSSGLDYTLIPNPVTNIENNFFASTVYTGGLARNPNYANNTGMNITMMGLGNILNENIENDQHNTTFRFAAGNDTYVLYSLAASVFAHISEPQIECIAQTIDGTPVTDPTNAIALPGSIVQYTLKLRNKGSEPLENLKIETLIPYLTEFVSANIMTYDTRVVSRAIFDPLAGAMGQIIWEVDYLPLTTTAADDVFAELILTLKVTEDCNLLAVSGTCEPVLILNGETSGVGALTHFAFDGVRFVYGFVESGPCENDPIYTPTVIHINSECEETTRIINVCFPSDATSIPYEIIANAFPQSTRFYDIIDTENNIPLPSSTEFTSANPFPAISGVKYYALPSVFTGAGIEACYWEFIINVTTYPEFLIDEITPKCGGDTVNLMDYVSVTPDNAIPYFYSDPGATLRIDSIVTPIVSTNYYVVAIIPMGMGCVSDTMIRVVVLPTLVEEYIYTRDTVLCSTEEEIILTASLTTDAPTDFEPEYLWYATQTSTAVLETGPIFNAGVLQTLPGINIDTTFYVVIRDLNDNYCETPDGYRKPVNVKIYPIPRVGIATEYYYLCGDFFILNATFDMGTDRTGATYQWQRKEIPDGNYVAPATVSFTPAPGGPVSSIIVEGTTETVREFIYYPNLDNITADTIILRLTANTPVCGAVTDSIMLFTVTNEPDGVLEIVEQPIVEVDPCDEPVYILKVTETGSGGLSNITVTLNDWRGSVIRVVKAEYLYPIYLEGGVENTDWQPMVLDTGDFIFHATIPEEDMIVLENKDSLWVRYTTYVGCGFFAGNDYKFYLDGFDACGGTPMTESFEVISEKLLLNWEGEELAEWSISSEFNFPSSKTDSYLINNAEPVIREIIWTISVTYDAGGEPDLEKDFIYFNIPTGMTVVSLTCTEGCDYIFDAAALDDFETGFDDPATKEYAIPLPDITYVPGAVITLDVVFTINEEITCDIYNFYAEVIHEDSLSCDGGVTFCDFAQVQAGSYLDLEVDLFGFEPMFGILYYGQMSQVNEDEWEYSGSFRVRALSDIYAGQEIEIHFYADMNSNSIFDEEIDEEMREPIIIILDQDYSADDILIITIPDAAFIPTVPGKQLLAYMSGGYVCDQPAIPLATLFGKQYVCVGDTVEYYTTGNMSNYDYTISSIGIGSIPVRLPLTGTSNWSNMDTAIRLVFTTADTIAVSARYVPSTGGLPLNRTFLNVVVLDYPELNYTNEPDTIICRGSQVELTHFVYDVNEAETVITFYREEANGTLVYVGDTEAGEPLEVAPWNDTKYRAVAVNAAGCESDTLDFWVYVIHMPQVWATVTTQPTCTETGSIIVTVTGGSGVYEYNMDGGTNYNALGDGVISGLAPGTYTIYILDVELPYCEPSVSEPVILTPNSGLYATTSVTDASGCNNNNGVIKLWANLGEIPYTYSTDGVDFSNEIPGDSTMGTTFAPGTYTFWVKDATGCIAATTATVGTGTNGIILTLDKRDAHCREDGIIIIEISGNGTPDYEYQLPGQGWVQMPSEIDSLPVGAGTHIVTVRDATGCTASGSITVGTVSTLTVAIDTLFNVVCEGTQLGSITFTVTGGRAPIAYYLNAGFVEGTVPASGTVTITGLQAGVYHFRVTDANQCTYTIDGIIIDKENDLLRMETKDTTVCNGTTVNLMSLITYTENVSTIRFYSDSEYTQQITNLNVTTNGRRYVRAFNIYDCSVSDSVYVRVLPIATPGTINVSDIKICTGNDTALIATAPLVENPVFTWYNASNVVLGTGDRLPVTLPEVTINDTLYYYVSVKGDNYCENATNNRKEVKIMIYPEPQVTVWSDNTFLCGGETFVVEVDYNVGTDLVGATYQWYHIDPVTAIPSVIPFNTSMAPNPGGNLTAMSNVFAYTPTPNDILYGYVALILTIETPVCGTATDHIFLYLEVGEPNGEIVIIEQPEGAQDPCDTVYYVVKVTEAGDGGLNNIIVTMEDWFGSIITVVGAEYFHDPTDWDYKDIADHEWNEAEFDDSEDFVFRASIPVKLENGDSLLVRFIAIAECGFYAGNTYLFELDGTDACSSNINTGTRMKTKTVESDEFILSFDGENLPEFWLESRLSDTLINNNIPLKRQIIWTVEWGYDPTSGDIDLDLQTIYFNIPTGMSIDTLINIQNFYDLSADELNNNFETGFDDPNTKEYQIPLPDLNYSEFDPATDTVKFQIVFTIDEGVACELFHLYVEIVHEDSLYCATMDTTCLFGFIKVGDYHTLEIDLYDFNIHVEQGASTPWHGQMYDDGELWGGSFRIVTPSELHGGHIIDITFYADMNNNGILDDDEIENYEMGAITYTIPAGANDTLIISIDPSELIPTEDSKQLLAQLGGPYVCATSAYPLVTLFGPQTICEGDTMVYYTSGGMVNYNFNSTAGANRIALEGLPSIGFLTDSAARYVFPTPGNYTISVNYQLPGRGWLNSAYMDVIVTQRPVLALAYGLDTVICRGSEIELTQFFKETTGQPTLIEFYEEVEGDYELIGDSDEGEIFVNPWITTTYRAVAYNSDGCVSFNSLDFTINVNMMPQVFATVTTQPTCDGDEGTIQISITGGSGGPYFYNWDGSATRIPLPGDMLLTGLTTGNYTVYLYDGNNMVCSPAISEPPVVLTPPSGLTASATVTDATDCAEATGTITLTASNGKPTYQYFITGISTDFVDIPAGGNLGNFAPNTYYITVRDAEGCTAATNATVGVVAGAGIILSLTEVSPANCDVAGVLGIKVSGGTAPYRYRLASEGLILMGSDTTSRPVAAGTHTIYVQDVEGCNTSQSITITNVTNLLAEIDTIVTVKCEGNSPGSITFTVTNAELPIHYFLNGNFNTGTITSNTDTTLTGLHTGPYTLLIVDGNGCTFTVESIVVGEDRDMPMIVRLDTSICVGNPVDLRDMIHTTSEYDSLLFSSDRNFITELYPPIVTDTITYYVRAFNIYGCHIDDSLRVRSWPYGNLSTISTTSLNVCSGGNANITASATHVINPYYRWYNSDAEDADLLAEGINPFTPPMPTVTINADTVFYVSVSGDNYCENPAGKRVPVTVKIFPESQLTLFAYPYNLCGQFQTVLTYELNAGDDPTTVTGYNWLWRNNNTNEWQVPNYNPAGSGGFLLGIPPSGGVPLPASFTYGIGTADLDSIVLRMQVLTNVCPSVTDTIIIYNKAKTPDALFELVEQPLDLQKVCTDTVYMVKVTEITGGLTNIQVTLDDYLSSWLIVSGAEYQYPIDGLETSWQPADFIAGTKIYYAGVPDIILENGDSLLVRFWVTTGCVPIEDGEGNIIGTEGSSLAGLNLRFLLDAMDACEQNPLPTKADESENFRFDWGDEPIAEYWVEAWFTPDVIKNGGSRKDSVTLSVAFAWIGGPGIPDPTLEGLYINIPFPTPLDTNSITSSTHPGLYTAVAPVYNPYVGETRKEWKFPIPAGLTMISDTVRLEMKLAVEDTISCGAYEFYVEIIHEGELTCEATGESCDFLEIIEGAYPILDVDLYAVEAIIITSTDEYYGVMKDGVWSGVYAVRALTPIFAGDSMMGIIYADMNNNNIVDAGDLIMDTIYYPTSPRNMGDTIPLYIGQPIPLAPQFVIPPIHTEDGKQMLIYITGTTVCPGYAGQAVPLFGEYKVCQGDTITYYTANGMLYYEWDILDTIKGTPVGNSIAELFRQHTPTPWTTEDSVVRAVFHKPGKYAIYTHYVPESGDLRNTMLNRTYMEIEVTPKPYLALTSGSSINICFGERVDLGQFVYDTVTNNNTILHYERIEPDQKLTPIGNGSSLIVEPWVTTTYRITATTANGICESANAVEFTINVQQAPRVEAISILANPTCVQSWGQLMLTVVGGSGQYKYSIDNEETYTILTPYPTPTYFSVPNLAAGTYTIYVKDDINTACPVAIGDPVTLRASNSGLYATATIDSATNCSSIDGIITLTVNGGQFPYQYSLNGSAYLPYPSDGIIADTLKTGHYNVTVRDAGGCIASAGDLFVPARNSLNINLTLMQQAVCDTAGIIKIEVTGGTSPYFYRLDGYGWRELNGGIDSVHALTGNRTIFVKDDQGCEASNMMTVTNAISNLAIFDINTSSFNCGIYGGLSFHTQGDPKPLYYSFSNFTMDSWLVNSDPIELGSMSLGYYHITLRDAEGCHYITEVVEITSNDNFLQAVNNFATTYVDVPVSGNLILSDYNYNNLNNDLVDGWEGPYHGSIEMVIDPVNENFTGHFTYTPNEGYVGLDTVKYRVTDGCNTEEAYLFITVLPLSGSGPRPPIAVEDYYYTYLNTPLTTENVLTNDVDPDGGTLTASLIDDSGNTAWGGTVTLNPNGTFVYTPRIGFIGVDEFWYAACNDAIPSMCDTTVVYIYVIDTTNFDLFVRAINDHYTTPKYTPLVVDATHGILSNDVFPNDLDSLIITLITGVNNGTLELDITDGSFIYTPNGDFIGSDGFTYQICGYRGDLYDCSEAYVNIFVYDNPCPNMPVLALDSGFICQGESIDLLTLITINTNVDSMAFYADAAHLNYLTSTVVNTQGYYYVRAFNVHECYVDTFVYVTVYPLPTIAVTVTGKDTAVCSNDAVLFNLTMMVTSNGDSLEFSRTKDFAILATQINAYSVNSPDTVKLYVRGLNTTTGCYTGTLQIDSITLIVNKLPMVATTVTGKDTTVCSSTPVNFNLTSMVTVSDGVLEFSETKYFTPLITTPTAYQVALNNTVTVYVRAHNSATGCITPDAAIDSITMTVHQMPTITVRDTAVCSNNSEAFDLMTLATTSGDSIQFSTTKDFGTLINPNLNVTSSSTVKIYVRGLNKTTECYSVIDSITISVNAIPDVSIITPEFTQFNCSNENTRLVLKTTSSCSSCTYLWSGGTAPLNRDSVIITAGHVNVSGTTFKVTITSIAGCSAVDSVTMTKNTTDPIPPVIDSTYQQFCQGATVADLNARGGNVVWYSNPTGGMPLPGYTLLVHNTIYYAATISGECESTVRSGVKVGIIPASELPAPNVQDQTLCTGATVADILTDGSNGIAIYATSGSTVPLADNFPLSTATYYAGYSYGAGACVSESRTPFIITLDNNQPEPPVVISPQTFCPGAQIANIKVPNTGIMWYLGEFDIISLSPEATLETDTYWAAQNIGDNCAESNRVPVQIVIGGTIPPPVTYGPYTLCEGSTIANINVSGYGVTWYADRYSTVALPLTMELPMGTHTFYAEIRGSYDCYSAVRAEVTVTVERCGYLLDCNALTNRIVNEDHYLAYIYTLTTTEWDIAPSIMATLDSAQYIISDTIYSSGPLATLQYATFPIGVSQVRVVGYFEDITDTCGFTVTVVRVCPSTISGIEGHVYNVTKLAGLCWTANLRATVYEDGTPITWAKPYHSSLYPDTAYHTETFGLLYTWYSAVGLPEGSTEMFRGYVQGICPEGWHIPSKDEWDLLNAFPAEHLKSADPSHWLVPGLDLYGFDSRPAGWYNSSTNRFEDLYGFTGYWSTLSDNTQIAHYFSFTYYCDSLMEGVKYKRDGLSVRCVMDY